MSDHDEVMSPNEEADAIDLDRRALFRGVGVAIGAAVISGCGDDDPELPEDTAGTGTGTNTGTGTGTGGDDQPVPFPDQSAQEVRWGFLIDLRTCSGCEACTVACKTANDVRLQVFRSAVRKYENGEFPNTKRDMVPWMCNHCENPPCIDRCPVPSIDAELEMPSGEKVAYKQWATYQRPDGLVLVDKERCVGCGFCVEDCPYGARYLDPVEAAGGDASKKVVDKCNLCIQRVSQGVVPACVNTCPGDARMIGNLNDPDSAISKKIAANDTDVLLPDAGTKPHVYYIGLNPTAWTKGDDPKLRAQLKHPEHHEAPGT